MGAAVAAKSARSSAPRDGVLGEGDGERAGGEGRAPRRAVERDVRGADAPRLEGRRRAAEQVGLAGADVARERGDDEGAGCGDVGLRRAAARRAVRGERGGRAGRVARAPQLAERHPRGDRADGEHVGARAGDGDRRARVDVRPREARREEGARQRGARDPRLHLPAAPDAQRVGAALERRGHVAAARDHGVDDARPIGTGCLGGLEREPRAGGVRGGDGGGVAPRGQGAVGRLERDREARVGRVRERDHERDVRLARGVGGGVRDAQRDADVAAVERGARVNGRVAVVARGGDDEPRVRGERALDGLGAVVRAVVSAEREQHDRARRIRGGLRAERRAGDDVFVEEAGHPAA